MFSEPPRIRNLLGTGTLFVLALSVQEQLIPGVPNWMALVAYLFTWLFGVTWVVLLYDFIKKSNAFAYSLRTLSVPDVRIAEANSELARQIRGMSAMQMAHHLQVLNALQLPTHFQPDDVINIGGRDVKISSVLEYINGMQPDGTMPPVRNYTREPKRTDIRHLAKTIENGYSVEAASNRSSVKTTKQKLHELIEAA